MGFLQNDVKHHLRNSRVLLKYGSREIAEKKAAKRSLRFFGAGDVYDAES